MKLIHTADLHLDSKMESNLSTQQSQKRRAELLDTFEAMVNYARGNYVRAILISGDMFDKSSPRKTALRFVIDCIRNNSDINFYYLKGNHDCEAFDAELSVSVPENMYFFDSKEWISYELEDVVITGREITDENINSIYSDLVLDSSKKNIVMLHGQEALYDGGDKTHTINIKNLKNKYIDYLALGHIHKYKEEKMDDRGVYCYPGCPEPRGFDECGQKGFVLLNVEDGVINTSFVSMQKRTFIEKEVEITKDMDMPAIYNQIEEQIKWISQKDLLKIVMVGYTDLDMDLDADRICDRFMDRFFFLKVYDKTKAYIDYANYAYDRTLKGSFVRLVQNLDISEEKKSHIIETGIRAIMGEDIDK